MTQSTINLVSGSVDSVLAASKQQQQGNPRKLAQYLAAISATLGAFALGNALGWSSPASGRLQGDNAEVDFEVTGADFAWVGSLLPVGAALSTFPAGFLVGSIGRRSTMFYVALPFIGGWALITWANGVAMLFMGRVVIGFCGGVFSVAAPLYIGEIADKEVRGTLGAFFQLMIVSGILFIYIIGAFVPLLALNIICLAVPLIFALIFFWMPETPQYHLSKGKVDEARRALEWFRGSSEVDSELLEMQDACARQQPVPLLQTFADSAAKRALGISVGLMAVQQLSGINAVVFYTEDLFKAAGSSLESRYSVMVVGSVQLVATIASVMVVDRLGRKPLMMISDVAMAVCTLVLGLFLFFREQDEASVDGLGWLPILIICTYFVAFSVGAGPIPWLSVGEIFPAEIKGTAAALSACINWFIAFIVTRFYGDLVEAVNGSTTFWIFTALLLLGLVFLIFVMPETRGKTLEEIQALLSGEKHNNLSSFSPNNLGQEEKQMEMHKF